MQWLSWELASGERLNHTDKLAALKATNGKINQIVAYILVDGRIYECHASLPPPAISNQHYLLLFRSAMRAIFLTQFPLRSSFFLYFADVYKKLKYWIFNTYGNFVNWPNELNAAIKWMNQRNKKNYIRQNGSEITLTTNGKRRNGTEKNGKKTKLFSIFSLKTLFFFFFFALLSCFRSVWFCFAFRVPYRTNSHRTLVSRTQQTKGKHTKSNHSMQYSKKK